MVASSLPEAEAAYLGKVLPALGILLALVLVGAAVFVACRWWWFRSGRAGSAPGFTLAELRDMKAAGRLTDEEFAAASAVIIGDLKKGPAPAGRDRAGDTTGAGEKATKDSPGAVGAG